MHIVVVGVDHHTAPVEVREQLAFRPSALPEVLAQLTVAAHAPLLEAVILSTCNRVEVYGVTHDDDVAAVQGALIAFLHRFHNLHPATHAALFTCRQDTEAVQHLFNTTCGLNSLIVGEPQIQGQVRTAYQVSSEAQTSGPILHALFRHAVEAGRRVRTETGIDRNAVSVSQAGVELARRVLGSLQQARILLVGSGKMSELAAKKLLDNGAQSITLVNRTVEKAYQLAQVWGGEVLAFEQLPQALCGADVVITSTSAPHTVIHTEHVVAAVANRSTPLIMIDLAVPRDIDEAVAAVPGARVYNIDDLAQVVATNLDRRRSELRAVEAIVASEVDRFNQWLSARAVVPTLNDLREQAEAIRQGELAKALKRLGPLDERERQIVEALTQGIVNKLLHQPTVRLKHEAAQGNGVAYAAALQTLFGLGTEASA
ncbi:MAG: glutamyl-tRNA reductase [Herpetosiphonaceae bacterium]|nr:glutamyl-tRNA reductase [Herpetosiphonaceae bacterium]